MKTHVKLYFDLLKSIKFIDIETLHYDYVMFMLDIKIWP